MSRRVLTVVWLTLLWLVLWRDVSVANVISGLTVAVLVSGTSVGPRDARSHRVHPVAVARFVVHFAWKLLEANVVLAREVVARQSRIRTGIIGVRLPGASDFVATIVANAVSLTPGTLTLEMRRDPDPVLYIHVLHLHDLEKARADVEQMAKLAGAAFRLARPTSPTQEVAER